MVSGTPPAVDRLNREVNPILTKKERERILRDYPETISKEQFYKLCQISKNRARELLIRGVVPCQITRRATHKYVIATLDAIAYL